MLSSKTRFRCGALSTALLLSWGCGSDDVASSSAGSGAAGGSGATSGSGAGMPAGCVMSQLQAGDHQIDLSHGGLDRNYDLHLPPVYDGTTPLPLVLNFHGLTSNAVQQAGFSAMNATADTHGFAVAYPEGYQSSWNGGLCCEGAMRDDIDDVGFARAVVGDIASKACIDPKRVYSTGMSNGGIMSHRLGCEATDLLAAIAPVCGPLLFTPCQPARPMPIIHFYGTADMVVSYNLGVSSNDAWVQHDGCTDMPTVTLMQGMSSCETHAACAQGSKVTFCTLQGMGHCWPGQSFCPLALGAANTDISANEEMWAFFQGHALP